MITDPSQTMELLRTILQPDINMKIQILLNEYLESHFKPAFNNMKTNLGKFILFCSSLICSHSGEENVHIRILDEVCANILENAKEVFQTKVELAKKQNRGKSPGQVLKRSSSSASNSPVSKKSCVIKSGKNEYE